MSKLEQFIEVATEDELEALAQFAETSSEYLIHLARGYGGRRPRVELAVRIEEGIRHLRRENRRLPLVTCEDLASGP